MDIKAPGPDGNWGNRVWLQNDQTGQFTGNSSINVYNGVITPDTWYRYVLGVQPSYTGNGQVQVWINGTLVGQYNGSVGYEPQTDGGLAGMLSSMMVKSGIYRSRINPEVAVAFGDIKYSNAFNLAAP
jgi:Polysaccharide lyase